MKQIITVPDLEALPRAAREFMGLMGDYTVFAFSRLYGSPARPHSSTHCAASSA